MTTMNRGTWARAAIVLAAGSVIAGCGGEAGPQGEGPSATPTATIPSAPAPVAVVTGPVPAAFTTRTPLPSCGTYDARPMPKDESPPPQKSRACFERALVDDTGAELMVTRVTVEGDRIPLYLRALPGSRQVEVFSDNTRDDFGTKVWTRQTCTGAGGTWLEPTGCTEPVAYLAHPITGTWIPRQIGSDFPKSRREGAKYTVTFAGDGTWTADDICDGTTGVYTLDATGTFSAQMTNSPPTAACDPGGVTKALTRTKRVVITSDLLRLLDSAAGTDAGNLGDLVPD